VVGHLAVISGRDRRALAARLPTDWLALGSYGLELPSSLSASGYPEGFDPIAARGALEAAGQELEALARRWPGTRLETKSWGRAVHFRGGAEAAFDDPATLEAVADVAARQGLEVSRGRLVIEVRPRGADKGSALAGLVRGLRPSAAVFTGDDLGDVPAWEELRKLSSDLPTLAAAVASPELDPGATEACDMVLDGRAELARFVDRLLELAEGRTVAPPG
jgi:trehalose 6-phosphate phosphatase